MDLIRKLKVQTVSFYSHSCCNTSLKATNMDHFNLYWVDINVELDQRMVLQIRNQG